MVIDIGSDKHRDQADYGEDRLAGHVVKTVPLFPQGGHIARGKEHDEPNGLEDDDEEKEGDVHPPARRAFLLLLIFGAEGVKIQPLPLRGLSAFDRG